MNLRQTTTARLLATFLVALLLSMPALGASEAIAAGTRIRGILLVNKHHPLPRNYAPGNNSRALSQVNQLIREAKSQGLNVNTATSGFRSWERQQTLFNNQVRRVGVREAERWVARPGHSEHQSGLAFDLLHTNGQLLTGARETRWVANNAHRFGFIVRYPAGREHITGFAHEPWHLRYVGIQNAAEIRRRGVTLEEFLGAGPAPTYMNHARISNTAHNQLRNLRVLTNGAGFTQSFAPTRCGYVVNVRENMGRVVIQPTRGNNQQVIRHRAENRQANLNWTNGGWSGWRSGNAANNRITININQGQERRLRFQVRDRNNNIREYVVHLRRASPNTFASGLRASSGTWTHRTFNRSVQQYTLNLNQNQTNANISMSRAHVNTQMRVRVFNGTSWEGWSNFSRANLNRTLSVPHGGERRVQFQFRGAFSDVAASPTRIRTYTITVRRAAQQHTVSFNSHGGTHVANRTVQNGRTIGALPTPTRTGYTFQGWFSAASGGTQVHANTVVTSNRTLHARWSANPVIHTITFDSMGVGSVGPIEVTHGAAMPAVVPPPKDGHSFVGWFTAAAGGVEVSVGTPIAANMHLFARWEPVGASGVSEAFDMNEHANDNVSESLEP